MLAWLDACPRSTAMLSRAVADQRPRGVRNETGQPSSTGAPGPFFRIDSIAFLAEALLV